MTGVTKSRSQAWIIRPRPNATARLRLFCFPNAGGGASGFYPWADKLPADIEVCPIQLPGREHRFREPLFTHVLPLVQTLTEVLYPCFDQPFAFFGHSMGALISFELARHLRKAYDLHPAHLFVSARLAPQIPMRQPALYQLPDHEFIDQLRRLNGTPETVLQNSQIMRMLLPVLRADFAVNETYTYTDEQPLDTPISAFGGVEDRRVNADGIEAWAAQTCGSFKLRMLPGDHFFIHTAQSQLLQAIAEDLTLGDCIVSVTS